MTLILRFFVLFTLLASFWANGQNLQYKLTGSFSTANAPDPANPILVNYIFEWNETNNSLQGTYQDNYYATAPQAVTGTITTTGRSYLVIFPEVSNGVKVLKLTTGQGSPVNGSIPINLSTEDGIGRSVDNINSFAEMSTPAVTILTQDNNSCSLGFGSLAGFCGIYSGTFFERSDPNNQCDLTSMGEPRLEVATDTNFNLYLNYVNTLEDIPFHHLGTFVFSPIGNSIILNRRVCEPLPGTSFPSGDCKNLTMDLTYYNQAGVLRLMGNYRITDETINQSCSYDISITREIPY